MAGSQTVNTKVYKIHYTKNFVLSRKRSLHRSWLSLWCTPTRSGAAGAGARDEDEGNAMSEMQALDQGTPEQGTIIQDVIRSRDEEARPSEAGGSFEELDIGGRLHQLRKSRGLTLQDVSRATGVSASAFSKIERNELSPTISTMQRIAQGLGIELTSLLADSDNGVAAAGRRSVTRAGDGKPLKTFTCDNTLLCADMKNKRVTPILTRVTARKPEDYRVWAKSDAEIFLMVIEGTLVVHSRHYEPLELKKGDSLYYDANSEHVWTSAGEGDAMVLWVLTVA